MKDKILSVVCTLLITSSVVADKNEVARENNEPLACCGKNFQSKPEHSIRNNHWKSQRTIYGWQLMTSKERLEHMERMHNAESYEEQKKYRAEHHQEMLKRAKERNIKLPDGPMMNGRGPRMDKDRPFGRIYGWQLMTNKERLEHIERMHNAKSYEEQQKYRIEHRRAMLKRAKERNFELPDDDNEYHRNKK